MSKREIIPNEVFGKRTVIKEVFQLEVQRVNLSYNSNYRYVLARCQCGEEKIIRFDKLISGRNQRCWSCAISERGRRVRVRKEELEIDGKVKTKYQWKKELGFKKGEPERYARENKISVDEVLKAKYFINNGIIAIKSVDM